MKKISILLLVLWGVIPSMLFAQRQLSFQNGNLSSTYKCNFLGADNKQ